MKAFILSLAAVAFVASAFCFTAVMANDDKEVKLKCVVNPKAAVKKANAADYKGGKVYTCCGGCLGKFKKNPEKFATMANHQLVASKQFVQAKCPISGGKAKADKSVTVGGVNVTFCCGNCQGKVKSAEGKAQIDLVFGDKAFKKGFVAAKK